MAINLPASFAAACLAGLKVPHAHQIMYCIAQETGQPYVFYKDGMERGQSQGGQWGSPSGPGPGPQDLGYAPPPTPQQQHPQQPPSAAGSLSPSHSQQLCDDNPSTLTSPVASPYPQPVVEVQQQQVPVPLSHTPGPPPHTPGPQPHNVGVPDDETVSVAAPQQAPTQQPSPPNQNQPAPQQQQQQQPPQPLQQPLAAATPHPHEQELSPPHSVGQHNPNGEVEVQRQPQCYNPAATPVDMQQQQHHHHQYPPNAHPHHYSPRGPGVGPGVGPGSGHHMSVPPHIMSPTSFMHYLKQPGLMLTPLGPMGTEAVMAENFNVSVSGNMQDMTMRGSLPDIIQQQQQQQQQHQQHQHQQQGSGVGVGVVLGGGLGLGKSKHANGASELRLFKCLTCGKDFKQKSTLLQHERIHTDSRPYGCTQCGKRFRQQSHLTQHLRIHANEKPFACVYCERTFRQRAILNQHLRIHSGEKPFQCPDCGKRFRQKAILNQHVRTHQDVSPHLVYKNGTLWPQDVPFPPEMDTKDHPTENGGSPFDSDHNPQTPDHQRQSNGCFSPESNVQYPAYFKDAKGMNHAVFGPGSNFALQYLKQGKGLPDVIQHGRSAGMPLYVRCPICEKEFKQKSTLLQHGCIHIESRPYPCPECGKRFRQQSHLTQHLRIHTNEKPYGCGYCGRNFRQRTILNQHLRIHTGEKPYKCSQCGKDFRQKAILDQHTRTHQGERPFCCPMPNCRRRFATEPEVKKHMDNHMNPHANKGRRPNNNPDTKHLLGRNVPPTAVVKPELYFPQCYVPFGHTNNAFGNNSVQSQNGDFKPIPTHAFSQNPNPNQTDHNVDYKNVQTAAVAIVAHQFPAPNNPNPVQAHANGEFQKPTPVQ